MQLIRSEEKVWFWGFSFNSLFEMLFATIWLYNKLSKLSILYLRCTRRASAAPLCFLATFNSLFEMRQPPLWRMSPATWRRGFQFSIWDAFFASPPFSCSGSSSSFNSLFEMPDCENANLPSVWRWQLSILYLRCGRGRLWRKPCLARSAFNSLFEMLPRTLLGRWRGGRLSILYLRCHHIRLDVLPVSNLNESFNSLFEMRGPVRNDASCNDAVNIFQFSIWDASFWLSQLFLLSSLRFLSILYLRCRILLRGGHGRWWRVSFQFSIWDATSWGTSPAACWGSAFNSLFEMRKSRA